jgi:hypothetical protein
VETTLFGVVTTEIFSMWEQEWGNTPNNSMGMQAEGIPHVPEQINKIHFMYYVYLYFHVICLHM